jgi:hypothetical protein
MVSRSNPVAIVSTQATNFQRIVQAEKRMNAAPYPLFRFLSAENWDKAE